MTLPYKIVQNLTKNEVTLDCFVFASESVKGHFIEFLISNIFG